MLSVLDVERSLIQAQLRDIDAQLKEAERSLNWNSQGQLISNTHRGVPKSDASEWLTFQLLKLQSDHISH